MPSGNRYQKAPMPGDERKRLDSLYALHILDTPPDERFDRITKMALHLFDVPISTVTLIDSNREWFKSCQGLPKKEGSRAISFCGHALLSEDLFIISDTKKDPRFAQNPMVTGKPYIRFYAGLPLRSADGQKVGVFCIKDRRPRKLTAEQIRLLGNLASWTELELNTREIKMAIEARQTAESKIRELNEILQLLHKNLSHDLLNHLTVMKGYAEMYSRNNNNSQILKGIFNAINRSAKLIKQMSKLEAAIATGAPLKYYRLEECIKKISHFFPEVKFQISGQGEVVADEALFSVIENIMRNASDHGKTGRMEIKINRHGEFIDAVFRDFGEGIPPNIIKKLFHEGFKYGTTGHTGLGLYIIKKTIERYGGSVKIDSSPHEGTTIILNLPSGNV